MVNVRIQNNYENFILNIQFESQAKWIGILGASGAGKSLTLKAIAGLERPEYGEIMIDHEILYFSDRRKNNGEKHVRKINVKPQLRRIGYMFQNYALFPNMTVRENIICAAVGSKEEREKTALEILRKFEIWEIKDQYPGQISGGQQQRVALARILATKPRAILLDEPFSALDENLRERMQQKIQELLADYDGTIIMVSHNRDEIYRLCEETVVVKDGKVIAQGKTKELFESPGNIEAAKLTGCKNFARIEAEGDLIRLPEWGICVDVKNHPDWVKMMQADYLGIRAHDFVPVWGELPEDAIRVEVKAKACLLFESRFFLQAADSNAPDICWFVTREQMELVEERGLPTGLRIPMNKVLNLSDRECGS